MVMFSYASGLISAIFSVSVCIDVQTLCVLLWVACAFLVNGGSKSVTYNKPTARRSFSSFAGDVLMGRLFCYSSISSLVMYSLALTYGVLCTNTKRNRVGCLIPLLVVKFPFGFLRRSAMWGSWRSLRRWIPRCLLMRWILTIIFSRFVQHS